MSVPNIQIKRKGRLPLYNYSIIVQDDPPWYGDAEVKIGPLGHYAAPRIIEIAKGHGLTEDDIFISIDQFYPNGHNPIGDEYPHLRKGIGSRVLTHIINDALQHSAKLADLHIGGEEMKPFIEKHGFTWYKGHRGDHYYKLIK